MQRLESTEAPSHRPDSAFPLRLACIDAGSNAIRFLVANFTDASQFEPIVYERVPVRLGHGVFLTGKLSETAVEAALQAFKTFRTKMDELGVQRYRAVATSAVRESSNGQELLDRIQREATIKLEVITGSEEARLVHLAIRSRIPLGQEPWILADLGGGSVEVSFADDSGVLWSESHTMGSVRLLEELAGSDDSPGRFGRMLGEYVARLRLPAVTQHRKPAGFIATGGNIEALATLAGAPTHRGVSRLDLGELRSVLERVSQMSFRERVEKLGLREDRADVILPAALVYERLATLAGARTILVPNVGVKEGLLLDMADDISSHRSHEQRAELEITNAALNLGRKYMFDEAHARHVAMLAASLFDQLQHIHGLRQHDRALLGAAAMLHDIGTFISYKKHHRHSAYLIAHSELAGVSPADIKLVANIARYHRKGEPSTSQDGFSKLSDAERVRVIKMMSLLRLADGFDREHRQVVSSIRAHQDERVLVLEPRSEEDILLERWQVKKHAQLFTRTFGLDVKVNTKA